MPLFPRQTARPPLSASTSVVGLALGAALLLAPLASLAQTSTSKPAATKPAAKPATKPATKKPAPKPSAKKAVAPPPVEAPLPEASAEQLDAAERVFYGQYACEFDQNILITTSAKHKGYVDVVNAKAFYVMKPVLSSTGAIRLEDVKGQTLMVQISSKSMLLDVKAGRRLVDECVSPRQRELIEAARQQRAIDAAAAAASAASAAAAAALPAAAAASAGRS